MMFFFTSWFLAAVAGSLGSNTDVLLGIFVFFLVAWHILYVYYGYRIIRYLLSWVRDRDLYRKSSDWEEFTYEDEYWDTLFVARKDIVISFYRFLGSFFLFMIWWEIWTSSEILESAEHLSAALQSEVHKGWAWEIIVFLDKLTGMDLVSLSESIGSPFFVVLMTLAPGFILGIATIRNLRYIFEDVEQRSILKDKTQDQLLKEYASGTLFISKEILMEMLRGSLKNKTKHLIVSFVMAMVPLVTLILLWTYVFPPL